jgi:alkylhydroperoxidase family enzyme
MNASPRIEPLPPQEWGELTEILEATPAVGDFSLGSQNIFSTLARHPDLFRSWLPFGGYMLGGGTLPARDRELLILRTAVRIGVEREAIDRVPIGAGAEGWTEHERALLQGADELHDDSSLSDSTWAALAQRYDQRQLIETAFLVGQYHLVAFALNACQVALDEGLEPLPSPLA